MDGRDSKKGIKYEFFGPGNSETRHGELLAGKCMGTSWPAASLNLATASLKSLEFVQGVFMKVVALSLSFPMPQRAPHLDFR